MRKTMLCMGTALLLVATAAAGQTPHMGGTMRIGEATSIADPSAHPERWFNKQVRIEGIVASVCKQEGCFIEVVPVAGRGKES